MAKEDNLTPWPKGVSGNPAGKQPGTKHISTWIQEMMDDETFEARYLEGYDVKEHKGAPLRAIVRVAAIKALGGDTKWADWLAKYGYRQQLDVTTNGKDLPTPILGSVSINGVQPNDSNQETSSPQ